MAIVSAAQRKAAVLSTPWEIRTSLFAGNQGTPGAAIPLDRAQVPLAHPLEGAVVGHGAGFQGNRALAQAMEQRMVMARRDHDASAAADGLGSLRHDLPELVVEGVVNLVQGEHVHVAAVRDGEAEPGAHAERVAGHRTLECVLQRAPLLYRLERVAGGL